MGVSPRFDSRPLVAGHRCGWIEASVHDRLVGSRHHTVPRFRLERWADKHGQVPANHSIEARHGVANIRDLATTDFYTVIDNDDRKNSMLESLTA